jgi:DNA repair protein RecO (recombination protein O)
LQPEKRTKACLVPTYGPSPCTEQKTSLIGADIINYFYNIKSDIKKMSYMAYLCELTKNVYKQNENDLIYDLFMSAILKVEDDFNPGVITNILELKYLDFLGVNFNADSCIVCGSKNILTISLDKGGYVCSKCRINERIMDEKALKMLRMYYYVDISKISKLEVSESTIREIDIFLTDYYDHYTGIYIKSKKFLNEVK